MSDPEPNEPPVCPRCERHYIGALAVCDRCDLELRVEADPPIPESEEPTR